MSILTTLSALSESDSDESAFLVAAAINLYTEALRRKAGRVLYTPADVKALNDILQYLLHPQTDVEYRKGTRKIEPSEAEKKNILEATERAIDQLKEVAL